MALPALPTPSQFNALRVTSGDPACTVLQNYVAMINYVADWYANIYNPDGSFTQEFIDKICATGCAGGGTGSSTTGASSSVSLYMASRFLDSGVYRGRFFYIDSSSFTYSTINGSMNEVITGIAVRPSDGKVFVLYYDWTLGVHPLDLWLGTISTSTGVITPIAITVPGGGLLPNPDYSLCFRADGTLFMSNRLGAPQIYTVNTTTGVPTALGAGIYWGGTGTLKPDSISFDASGILYGYGCDGSAVAGTLFTINTTPNPSYGLALVATLSCGSVNPCGTFNALAIKGGQKMVFYTGTGDLYSIRDGSGCLSPAALKMLGSTAMADVTAAGGIPS